jgi:hypothetical protein
MDSSSPPLSKHRQRIKRVVELGYTVNLKTGKVFQPNGSLQETHLHTGTTNRSKYLVFSAKAKPLSGVVYVHSLASYLIFGDDALMKGIEACHIDNNRINNTGINIKIGTSAENKHDISLESRREYAIQALQTKQQRLTAKGRTGFTNDQVQLIRAELACGTKVSTLFRAYNVNRCVIYDIKNRKTYRNVPEVPQDPQYVSMYSA